MADSPRDGNRITGLLAASSSDGITPVVVYADPSTHRLYCDVSISSVTVSGSKSNNAVVPGSTNLGVLPAVANAAAPTLTETFQTALSVDLSGNLRTTTTLGTSTNVIGKVSIDQTTPGTTNLVALAANQSVNVAQINGVTTLMGNGVTGTGSQRVTIASDNTPFAVKIDQTTPGTTNLVALTAETTKVIGTVRQLGNAGAILDAVNTATTAPANGMLTLGIYNSTEPSPTTGQSVGIQLDAKGRTRHVIMDAAGNTRGANVDASNRLSVTVDNVSATNISTNIAQMNGVTVLMGNGTSGTGAQRVSISSDNSAVSGLGAGATGSAVPANAVYKGLQARTSNPSAATEGNTVGAIADKLGRQVVVLGNVRDNKGNQFTTITSSTSETTVVTAVASTFLDVYGCIVENTSATGTKVTFKDSTAGTTQFEIYVPATETRGFMLPSSDAFKQTTVNTNWTATCGTSVASVVITMLYVKNI